MPFALVGIGLILIVTGMRDTHAQLGRQLVADFTGQQNFSVWVLAIGSVGALGYVAELKTFSRYFLALILISMMLSQKGFFQSFMTQFNAGPLSAPSTATSLGGINSGTPSPDPATLPQHQSGLFGQAPTTKGQAGFNGWMNYIFGGGFLN